MDADKRHQIVGSRTSGRLRFRAAGGEALAEPELRADGHGRYLDEVVSYHQAEECTVRMVFHSSALIFLARVNGSCLAYPAICLSPCVVSKHSTNVVSFLKSCAG